MKLPNEVLASRQAQVRWCSAVARVRGMRKHLHKQMNEPARLDIDSRATTLAMSGESTDRIKERAAFYMRFNHDVECAVCVRAVIKRVLKDTRSKA